MDRLAAHQTALGRRYRCRCCGYLTLERYDAYDVCPVCKWEDEDVPVLDGESGGPNHISLSEGRRNFAEEGVCCPAQRLAGRDPLPAEHPWTSTET